MVQTDRGYSWLVVGAAFFIAVIIDGFLYCFGAISKDLKEHYLCKEWAVSLIISLASGFYWISAPVTSVLCNRWSCRSVGILGSFVASSAILVSSYCPNIYSMWFCFGVIGGIGLGFTYLPSIIIIGYCFEKKHAIAMGIATAGSGIGSIAFGPLSRILFDYFGWETGLRIFSCILISCAALSSVMVSPVTKKQQGVINDNDKSTAIHQDITTSTTEMSKPSQPAIFAVDSRQIDQTATNLEEKQHLKTVDRDKLADVNTVGIAADKTVKSSILSCRPVLFICLANIFIVFGYLCPYLFIVRMAMNQRNISEKNAVYLLSVLGFSTTLFRFVSGWITKIPRMSPLFVNNIGLSLAGISTILVPLYTTLTSLLIYCIIWGGFTGLHISLNPVIVRQYSGLEQYANALGMTFLFRGIASFIAPPILGVIADFTLSFDLTFVIGGLSFLIGVGFHLLLINYDVVKEKSSHIDTEL